MTQFFYFCDVSEDIVNFFLLSLAQGATRWNNAAELNDLMLQTTPWSSVFSGGCPSLGSNVAPRTAYLYLSGNELCIGATVRVPTERAVRATSGTPAIGSPSLGYCIRFQKPYPLTQL